MSTRNRGTVSKQVINPLAVVGGKQCVGQETADEVALHVLCQIDAAKRGKCTFDGAHELSLNLVTAQVIASYTQSRMFYDLTCKALVSLAKACTRTKEPVSLTTGEYLAIRQAAYWYLRALPDVASAMFASAAHKAKETVNETLLAA